ncbi:immunity 52 family protein [Corallococcus exiguus]|uniref:immunity 52 family protein n=1 Tax=Corallococcus exiguus TaxID=83462 RepID=UPI001A8C561C|nr:immunity 52 family protein [Corallococcus exiguus]MBN8468000.1 immunity 52 family protein [Corallococcus exiguus]
MTETYYAGVYWPGRPEPLETYARRAEALFQRLASTDPSLATWYEQARSRESALNSQVSPDVLSLQQLFTKTKYQVGEGEISFAAWNGRTDDSSVVNFSCGDPVPDAVDLCVWTPAARELLSEQRASQVLKAMVLAWEPDWGVVISDEHRDSLSESGDVGTFIGWMTYFSRHRGPVPPLPGSVRVEPVEDQGTLVILTPERFTLSKPEHVSLAEEVQDQLQRAGLLEPLRAAP